MVVNRLEFSVPLKMKYSKTKFFTLNLNQYRNAHHRILSNSKSNFDDYIKSLHLKEKCPTVIDGKVKVTYKCFRATKHKYDLMNVASIIDKFTMDALVKEGILHDDNYLYVAWPKFIHGGVDKENPRCDVVISVIN